MQMKYSVSAKTVSRRTHEQEVGAVLPEPFGVAEEGVRPNHRISGLLLLTYLLTYLLLLTYQRETCTLACRAKAQTLAPFMP